jgi:branched-subunit amino acid aminotransferase/4-amino-4-deoxychorismate lyase
MDFNDCKKPTLLMQAVELKEVPRALKMKGVDAVTVRFGRLLPEAKTISLLPMILAKRAAEEAGAYEAVFVDGKGCVLEGTVTNVFIVKKGVLYTAGKGVLPGTTAKALIKAARSAGMKVVRGAVKLAALKNADEVFLTNAPRGIVPVKRVDGKRVGTGKTGSVTKKLMLIFEAYICRNI